MKLDEIFAKYSFCLEMSEFAAIEISISKAVARGCSVKESF